MHPNAGKLIFIAALPKSASSLAWLIVSALQEADGRANPSRQKGKLPHPLLPLTWDLLDRFPEGGTYKSHAPIYATTAGFLQLVGSTSCFFAIPPISSPRSTAICAGSSPA
jgi:hypothetical protein